MRTRTACLLVSLAAASVGPLPVRAESAGAEGRLRDALRSTTAQLRALEDERAAWQAREAAMKTELESLRKGAAAARSPAGARCKGADLARRLAEETEAREKLAASLAESEAAARRSADEARAKEEERARQAAEAASLRERLAASEARNGRMYKVGKDILDWLSNMGVGAAIAAREPFLGLKRVELENGAQDFEDKLLEQRVNHERTSNASPQ